jgi:predicted transcriptional regulator
MNRASNSRLTTLLGLTILVGLLIGCAPSPSSPAGDPNPVDDGPIVTETACETNGPMQLVPDSNGHYELLNIPARSGKFCALILPLDSRSLNAVLRGAKTVDYRRSLPTDRVSHIIYFNTKTLELYASAEVDHSLAGSPRDIAELTASNAGTNLNGAMNYFGGRQFGFAIAIKKAQILANPMGLEEARSIDSRFARPYGYLFLERHPKLNQEFIQRLVAFSAP